tara:strand:+ start:2337 stop:3140 length:804 start_codon:yes stop_codon:yes gene_type:complete
MSSIYQKGRDGYYYYQAYVENPDTGKKDKRVFHSLGTKDKVLAEQKQKELDNKYLHRRNVKNQRKKFSTNKTRNMLFKILIATLIITVIYTKYYDKKSKHINIQKSISNNIKKPIHDSKKHSAFKANQLKKEHKVEEKVSEPVISYPIEEKKTELNDAIRIPEYFVFRVNKLSGTFNQVKIFVTVEGNPVDEMLLSICKKLKKEYKEFSNIIICLYTNDQIGKEIANGAALNISLEEKKNSWLAMYSYNSVEGEYFDTDPGEYIGAF